MLIELCTESHNLQRVIGTSCAADRGENIKLWFCDDSHLKRSFPSTQDVKGVTRALSNLVGGPQRGFTVKSDDVAAMTDDSNRRNDPRFLR